MKKVTFVSSIVSNPTRKNVKQKFEHEDTRMVLWLYSRRFLKLNTRVKKNYEVKKNYVNLILL